eukprot:GHVS01002187.1.p1 GENE.GHVS01002187.1~~GHVS01002187.1.p1  ORF type:complete len:577 (+),score=89.46 GHVS01002187.1:155-1885(+)
MSSDDGHQTPAGSAGGGSSSSGSSSSNSTSSSEPHYPITAPGTSDATTAAGATVSTTLGTPAAPTTSSSPPSATELLSVHVKTQSGNVVPVSISSRETVHRLSQILIPLVNIPIHHQRLVAAGRILQSDRTLDSYGIVSGQIVYVLNNAPAAAPAASTAMVSSSATTAPSSSDPSTFGSQPAPMGLTGQLGGLHQLAGQQHGLAEMLDNRDLMAQMLNSPLTQNLMDNPQFMRTILEANPQLRELRERNPELNHILNDPQMLRQSLEMMRNPSLLREMMRSTDRAMINIEAIPGGFNALRRMYHSIQEPLWNVVDSNPLGGPNGSRDQPTPNYDVHAENPPDTDALPNPWAPQSSQTSPTVPPRSSPPTATLGQTPPTFNSSPVPPSSATTQAQNRMALGLDPNSLAAMMQDPNMQSLMSGMMNTPGSAPTQPWEGYNSAGAAPTGPTSSTSPAESTGSNAPPLANPELLRTMFAPQSLQAMSQLQQAMENMNVATAPAGTRGNQPAGSSPVDFRNAYTNYIGSQNENPEVLYQSQLAALRSMGFSDTQACIRVLQDTNGNLNRAIDRLLGEGGSQ